MSQGFVSESRAIARWAPQGFAGGGSPALIGPAHVAPIIPGLDLWDCWPLAHEDGRTAVVEGRQYWFFLSAPRFPDPFQRHDAARIRLLSRTDAGWQDHGDAMPDGFSPGTREWAGCAVLHDEVGRVTLFFTAAGRRGEAPSLEQRLFETRGSLGRDGPAGWEAPREVLVADGGRYQPARDRAAAPGLLKAFRDPAWFRDPRTGRCHLLFAGSAAWSDHPYNGVIGLATWGETGWGLVDPLLEAIGVSNELERPHVVMWDGLYYMFWSTQRHTFAPGAVAGPNGLYGAVAEALTGPWRAVNTGGLVAANPEAEPLQAYSWWVTGEGDVWSFIDQWGLQGRRLADHPGLARAQFGGTPAPVFRLAFEGARVRVVG
ncbi:MAG: glycoside hydrolase family 68 protein [Candidatus Sericytochromatia bacterium]|nr:glycoside hydrolase family 68 protein [Candidatus Sericytochromatia bacterium]